MTGEVCDGSTSPCLAEGEITEQHVGLKGTMNQLFPKELGQARGGTGILDNEL
ncbi:hypothetical protein SAMN04488020_10534 [Palleronia marisminoris]|uniref:Uncharacterized protein n=1 Tax=Palleronia marisminoris TaxID=315423 RepID=A0A1Y5SQL2_9RHOB|nr:hypothetical protein SAMN04488020_10534 [Palleronia marisminoris]SLN45680.1 hypothetical protein PAM7066_01979 [Palleronia marisminoris]